MLGMFGLAIDVQAGGLGPWTFIGGGALVAGSIWLYGGAVALDPAWWMLVLVCGATLLFMLVGHDGNGAEPFLDADDRSRGARSVRWASAEVGCRSRRRRARARRAVASADEPGDADRGR